MANVNVSEGSGKVIATRQVAGVEYQVIDVYPGVGTVTGPPVSFTVTATATGKAGVPSGGTTFNLPTGTTHVRITVEVDDVKFTEDGVTTPSATVGNLLPAGTTLVELDNALNLNFVRSGAVNATVTLSPRKYP